jgi:hypothetical protein
MVGEIISEWWATSNRNGGRDHSGMVGDIERNQHSNMKFWYERGRQLSGLSSSTSGGPLALRLRQLGPVVREIQPPGGLRLASRFVRIRAAFFRSLAASFSFGFTHNEGAKSAA